MYLLFMYVACKTIGRINSKNLVYFGVETTYNFEKMGLENKYQILKDNEINPWVRYTI